MSDRMEYCYDCSRHHRSFEFGMALLNYNEAGANSMARIKYHNKREYLDFYGEAIVRRFGKRLLRINPDALIPVPVHPSKMRKRGYNQAELLAARIGSRLGVPVLSDLLVRSRKTEPQKDLSPQERFKNLEKAFLAEHVPEDIRRVVLVDDIYTTGSTAEACTRALKQQGIETVYILTIYIGYGK